eukprot:m.30490 g.30490  ORF g.30490 m.30490 type:complete len:116 (+) comp16294_c0_seq1:444-791(+)
MTSVSKLTSCYVFVRVLRFGLCVFVCNVCSYIWGEPPTAATDSALQISNVDAQASLFCNLHHFGNLDCFKRGIVQIIAANDIKVTTCDQSFCLVNHSSLQSHNNWDFKVELGRST